MKSRIFHGLLIVALLVPAFGCPRPPAVSPGVWVFEAKRSDATSSLLIGLVLNADGTTDTPDPLPSPATTTLDGTVTWVQNGSTFAMNQVSGSNTFQYTVTVDSPTTMSGGTWMTIAGTLGITGTWSAEKLP